LEINSSGKVDSFIEKPTGDGMWINGGFFVLEPGVFDYLVGKVDDIQWEKEPLAAISKDNQLAAFKHFGFWKCMDALRDRVELEEMWNSGNAKWKIW
jgi:glucose-1-phosphate cytidylyltransferase